MRVALSKSFPHRLPGAGGFETRDVKIATQAQAKLTGRSTIVRPFLNILCIAAAALSSAFIQAQAPSAGVAPTGSPNSAATTTHLSDPIAIYPLEVMLVRSLDSAAIKQGDHVLTKLTHVWTDGTCTLPSGSALSGEVIGIHEWTRQDKQTRITLQFRYTCRDTQHRLRLITLLAPEMPDLLGIHGNPVIMQAMRSTSFGEGNPTRPAGNTRENHVDMSGRQNPQWPLFVSSEPNVEHRPTEVKSGMVWHLPGIALSVSEGEPFTSSIVSSHASFKLPAATVLVMQPELLPDIAPTTEPRPLIPRNQLPTLAPEITACPATSCSSVVPATSSASIKPAQEFSVRRYGSSRGQAGEIEGLEYTSAVAFLGSDQVLVCLGKPGLVERTSKSRPEDHPHLIEAVLYDVRSGRVVKTMQLSVPNRDRYLWQLSDGRVLIHRGDQLVWYGPGLVPEQTLKLTAPLAFVHTTADGAHTLVGTLRELHSTPEHAELYSNDNRAPEEEVQETLYDAKLQPVTEARESSRAMPPILWNTGRVSLRHRSRSIWYFRETLWNGEQRAFGTLTSSCVPQTSAVSGDRLLVIGCETHSLNAWAHILRPDGSIVLRTTVHTSDLYPLIPAASTQNLVLLSPRLNPAANRDGALHATDIIGEAVHVVSRSNGSTEFASEISQPITSAQAVAISAEGNTLAVLDSEVVRLYTLPSAQPQPGQTLTQAEPNVHHQPGAF